MAGELPSGRGGPHVFVADLDAPALTDADRHHLERVLRARPGDPLTVSDGQGRWRPCTYGAEIQPAGDVVSVAAEQPAITVAFALTKGERPELAVQKLTELGVDRIVPFTAGRSVVRWDAARAARHVERLRRVAREAAMQCRRVRLPDVAGAAGFDDVAALPGAVLAERDGPPPDLARPTVLVGPEGGWDSAELARDLPTMGLAPTVLRAETAAIAAGAVLVALRHGRVRPATARD